MSKRSFRRRFI